MNWSAVWDSGASIKSKSKRPKRSAREHGYVVGLDLSLRAAGIAVIPFGWDGADLSRVSTATFGATAKLEAEERVRLRRVIDISEGIERFIRTLTDDGASTTHIFVEQYAFSSMSSHAHALGECGGVVKVDLFRNMGIVTEPIVASAARKTLLVKCPRAKAKPFVVRNVRRLEGVAREWTEDEIDAFVIANEGLNRLGRVCMSFEGV